MMYLKASRYNNILRLETLAGFHDESVVIDEANFLTSIQNNCDDIYGIVSNDTYDVLNAAYKVQY